MNKSFVICTLAFLGAVYAVFVVFTNKNMYHALQAPMILTTNTKQQERASIFVKGLYEVREWTSFNVTNALNGEDPELEFYRFINREDLFCLYRARLGTIGDGGWDMCLAGPYNPTRNNCLAYSFGINYDWSFEDSVSNKFGCLVRTFDPTMEHYPTATKRDDNIYFYPIGIYGNNTVLNIDKKNCQVKTLGSLTKQFGDEKRVIDYLKMDVEESEWSALEAMFNEGVLAEQVKQIGIEFHTSVFNRNPGRYFRIVTRLEDLGFLKWKVNWNMQPIRGGITDCFEVYYINIKFVHPK